MKIFLWKQIFRQCPQCLFDEKTAEPVLERPAVQVAGVQGGHQEALGRVPVVSPLADAGQGLLWGRPGSAQCREHAFNCATLCIL